MAGRARVFAFLFAGAVGLRRGRLVIASLP